jgi:hypothetical protein
MPLEIKYTSRGFALVEDFDLYGTPWSIQDSSLATKSAIWLGAHENRAHLDQEQVAALLPLLQRFVETGSIAE